MNFLKGLSCKLLAFEEFVLIALAAAMTLLIMLNVTIRSVSNSLYWVEELAIYLVIWMVCVGASICVQLRTNIPVPLIIDSLPGTVNKKIRVATNVLVLMFSLILIWTGFIWFDPITLISLNFDFTSFSELTFNYIYEEQTSTIGIKKFWVWLIIPITGCSMTLHSTTNLLETYAEPIQTSRKCTAS